MKKDFSTLKEEFQTVVGITTTPFAEDGSVDYEAYDAIIRKTVDAGVTALTPNGNTSEFYSLSPEERIELVRRTREIAPEINIIAGVGLDSATLVSEVKQFLTFGVDAVMLHQPVHPFWSPEGWIRAHELLAEEVPEMPIVPYLRSPRITTDTIVELLHRVPNVIAMKYAIEDPIAFAAVVNRVPEDRVTWICGLAEMWAPFFRVAGATGFTSGLVSVDPHRSLRMLEALNTGDYETAMKEQAEIAEFEALRARNASEMNVTAVKEALGQIGACRSDVRAPLSELPEADKARVGEMLKSWGVL